MLCYPTLHSLQGKLISINVFPQLSTKPSLPQILPEAPSIPIFHGLHKSKHISVLHTTRIYCLRFHRDTQARDYTLSFPSRKGWSVWKRNWSGMKKVSKGSNNSKRYKKKKWKQIRWEEGKVFMNKNKKTQKRVNTLYDG